MMKRINWISVLWKCMTKPWPMNIILEHCPHLSIIVIKLQFCMKVVIRFANEIKLLVSFKILFILFSLSVSICEFHERKKTHTFHWLHPLLEKPTMYDAFQTNREKKTRNIKTVHYLLFEHANAIKCLSTLNWSELAVFWFEHKYRRTIKRGRCSRMAYWK